MSSKSYLDLLQQIKKAEEEMNSAIQQSRNMHEEELERFRGKLSAEIEAAKKEAEELVNSAVDKARKDAELQAKKIINEAREKAEKMSEMSLDEKVLLDIIRRDLFSDLEAEG